MQIDNRNMILAIVLSLVVLFGWQYFVAGPQMEKVQREAQVAAQQQADQGLAPPAATGEAPAAQDAAGVPVFADRAAAVAATPRVGLDTAALEGSINLTGGRRADIRRNN